MHIINIAYISENKQIQALWSLGVGGGALCRPTCRCSMSGIVQLRLLFMYTKFHAFNLKCKVLGINRPL